MKEKPASNLKQGLTVLFFVVNVFMLVAIFSPEDHFSLSRNVASLDKEVAANPASISSPTSPNMVLEWRVEDRYQEGEWEVEKYREYEIYLDEENRIVKEEATSHYNYLKYWRY